VTSERPGQLPLPEDQALVVVGSLSTKPQDRSSTRQGIVPVQVVTSESASPVPFFADEGELGISSACFFDRRRMYFSLGDDLTELDLEGGHIVQHDVPGLSDVHEMTSHDGDLLMANTGKDEVVVFSPERSRVVRRIALDRFRRAISDPSSNEASGRSEETHEAVDRFHLNQVFPDSAGRSWVLVHHVNGKQLIKRVAEKVIKSHGNGGVINLSDGVSVPLQLHAPHSVRQVGDDYWVFDSGRGEARIYSQLWEQIGSVATVGWGRGAEVAADGAVVFAGMSPIRKRYLPFLPDRSCFQCCVEVFDATERRSLGSIVVENIEQINGVHLIDRSTAELLVAVPPRRHRASSAT
jgi:hypothetical protein